MTDSSPLDREDVSIHPKHNRWTAGMKIYVLALRISGKSRKDLALQFGVSTTRIDQVLRAAERTQNYIIGRILS